MTWGCVSGQSPPEPETPPPASPGQSAGESPEPLAPLPYPDGVDHRYTWVHEGEEFATTVLAVRTVKEPDEPIRIHVTGRLDYERAGRILIGTSEITFEGDIGHPVRYESRISTGVPNLGEVETTLAARFEGGLARITRKEGVPQLRTSEVPVEVPTYLLDDQCFEHWALLAPYFDRIGAEGKLTVFVPHGEKSVKYTVRHERTEGGGETRRERWAVEQPAMKARLWTDAAGRLVEYVQGEIRIILVEPGPSPKEPREGAGDGTDD